MTGEINFDFWLFLAGLGLFLFGMYHLEKGLNGLAGKSFRNLLERVTNQPWKGVISGASVTAVVQSSSLVMLLVVAFLGAGLMPLTSAIGVVLGANLGTTGTAWIVATLGFKVDISNLSFPFLAIGTFTYVMLDRRKNLKNIGSFLIGFGLLFLGLDYLKESIEDLSTQIDLADFVGFGLWVFLGIGIVITALIQSSSAMIVIVLSVLYSGIIDIYQAMAVIIGANIGTTSTLILASLKGPADKKRLATVNVFFNLVSGTIAFIFLEESVDFVLNGLHISEPLMELVLLNTLLNLGGIILFFPFIGFISQFMRKRFLDKKDEPHTEYIQNASVDVPDLALKSIKSELTNLFYLTKDFISECMMIDSEQQKSTRFIDSFFSISEGELEKYAFLKKVEDEISAFYYRLQEQNLKESDSKLLSLYMHQLRELIYAAKEMKDVHQNIHSIQISEDKVALEIFSDLQKLVTEKIGELTEYIGSDIVQKPITEQQLELGVFYQKMISKLYKTTYASQTVPISTLTNVIRKTIQAMDNLSRSVCNKKEEEEILAVIK